MAAQELVCKADDAFSMHIAAIESGSSEYTLMWSVISICRPELVVCKSAWTMWLHFCVQTCALRMSVISVSNIWCTLRPKKLEAKRVQLVSEKPGAGSGFGDLSV